MNIHLQRANTIVKVMDKRFLDSILGLIPGIGDAVSLAISSYLIWIAIKYRLPKKAIMAMIWNIGFDFVIGTIPVAGDLLDFFYHANVKNLEVLNKYKHYFSEVEEGVVMS